MFDAIERFLSSVLETATFAATAIVVVWILGLVVSHVVGAGKAGRVLFLTMPAKIVGFSLKLAGKGVAKVLGRAAFEVADFKGRVERAPDPEAPLVRFEERRPMEPPSANAGARPKIEHGDWYVFARTYREAVHMVMVGAPGAGKDQAGVMPMLKAQLEHSDEHLVILDPKRELRRSLSPYLRPDDRVFVYSFSRKTGASGSLSVALDEEDVADVAAFLMPEEGQDGHWARTAQRLFVQVEAALFREYGRRPTVLEIFDAVEDPDRFDALCEAHPRTKRVSPNEKEFGSVYSTLLSRLDQLRWPRVRRVFADAGGGSGTSVAKRPFGAGHGGAR